MLEEKTNISIKDLANKIIKITNSTKKLINKKIFRLSELSEVLNQNAIIRNY